MNSIYKDKYVEIFIDLERSLIFDVWFEACEEIYDNEQIFIDFLIVWRDIVLQNNIRYALTDVRQMLYNPSPQIQENELMEVIKTVSANSFQKQAFITSSDFIQLLTFEQIKNEYADGVKREVSNFFLSQDEAIAWLLSGGDSSGISSGTARLIGMLITFGSLLNFKNFKFPKRFKPQLS